MDVSQQLQSISAADAEARLRYVQDVRVRTRHATVIPALVVVVLGALIIARGVLMRYWPHGAVISTASLLGLIAARPLAARWLAHRQQMRGGILPAPRGRRALTLIGIAGALTAVAIGANPFITGAAAAMTLAAWLAGMPTIAAATAAIGLTSDALLLRGAPPSAALVIFGIGVVAVGFARRHAQEHTP